MCRADACNGLARKFSNFLFCNKQNRWLCLIASYNTTFGWWSFLQFAILRSRTFCWHSTGSSKVQLLAHKSNSLVLQKKYYQELCYQKRTHHDCYFLLSSCDMSLLGKLVVIALCWLLNFFFLKSKDALDAVLSTDLGEQRCFKFLIRELVCLNKTKIICSVPDRKPFICCLWFLWCEDLACDWLQHNKHTTHILGVHANLITAVNHFPMLLGQTTFKLDHL